MKIFFCLGLMLSVLACKVVAAPAQDKPAREPVTIAFTEDDFRKAPAHKEKEVTVAPGEKFTVKLGSNPTTGFSWGETPSNSDTNVVKQSSHARIAPEVQRPGAGGAETWAFEALKAGSATLDFSYGRPWQGGEKGTWTLKVKVKVQ